MELYKDTENQKVILVCNATDIMNLEHATFSKAKSWYDKAREEKDSLLAEIDISIAQSTAAINSLLNKAYEMVDEQPVIK